MSVPFQTIYTPPDEEPREKLPPINKGICFQFRVFYSPQMKQISSSKLAIVNSHIYMIYIIKMKSNPADEQVYVGSHFFLLSMMF